MSELYTVEVVASAPSNAVRSHDHPMLESGNLSFPKGRYLLDFRPGEDRSSYVITHRIEGVPLIDHLLESGQGPIRLHRLVTDLFVSPNACLQRRSTQGGLER